MRLVLLLASMSLSCALAACSDDEDAPTKESTAKKPPRETSTGDKDPDAAAPSLDAGVDQDTPDVAVDQDAGIAITFFGDGVACGEAKCQNVRVGGDVGIDVVGCCADKTTSVCGLNLKALGVLLGLDKPGCEPLNAPGSEDSVCEASAPIRVLLPDAPPEGLVLAPCCQASGQCGFDANVGGIGFGCVAPERFRQEPSGECKFTSGK